MLFAPDRDCFLTDIYHSLGCFFACEKGLFRGSGLDKSLLCYVFPQLHSCTDSYVASLVTKALRSTVTAGEAKSLSSKSLRKGAVTLMAAQKDINFHESVERSGHATGANIDAYRTSVPTLNLPGGRALSGWDDCHQMTFPPRLECLGTHAMGHIDRMIGLLYVIDVPELKENGKLRPFLRTCTASLIMYHQDVLKEFGPQNAVVELVLEAAQKADIVECETGAKRSADVLKNWSVKIANDFRARNTPHYCTADQGLKNMLESQVKIVHKQAEELTLTKTLLADQVKLTERLLESISQMQEQMVQLSSRMLSPRSKYSSPHGGIAGETSDEHGAILASKRVSPENDPSVHPKKLLKCAPPLQYKSLKKASSNAKVKVETILCELHELGYFKGKKDMWPPSLYSTNLVQLEEKDKFVACMELVDTVLSKDQWKILCAECSEKTLVLDVASAVQKQCMERMEKLEVEVKIREVGKKTTRAMPFYVGLGARYVFYKKKKDIMCAPSRITALDMLKKNSVNAASK
jgi:hypothetical protein